MSKGPEDESKWGHPSNKTSAGPVVWCHSCKRKIEVRHCAESGCPWCGPCGAKLQEGKD